MNENNRVMNQLFIAFSLACLSGSLFLLPSLSQNNDDIEARIKRQMGRINRGQQEGVLNVKQAKELKDRLNDIALQVANTRKKTNGQLSQTQLTKFDNDLNLNFNNIKTKLGAGKQVKTSGKALGPRWAVGTDGAQDPKRLRRQMKLEEKRQLKQYDQAMQQVQEMQQQQYEKDMLKTLGQQRPQILNNKEQLEKIREQSGAN